MRYKDQDSKLGGSYRRSIFIRQAVKGPANRGVYDYLQATYTRPAGLKAALLAMRIKNPDREYVTDDPDAS